MNAGRRFPRFAAGLDIGGTTTRASVVDGNGAVLASAARPTQPTPSGVLDGAAAAVGAALAAAGRRTSDLACVGVGLPGAVDAEAGTVRHATNLGIAAAPLDVRGGLHDRLGVDVWVDNDVNVAALGAACLVPGLPDPDDLAYLGIGTGIAAGYVLDGRVRRGATGVAGEIGHLSIDPAGPRCGCGQYGCIEAIASGSAIARAWPTDHGSAARALLDAASSGDTRAAAIWTAGIGGVVRALEVLTLAVDPRTIVLGGGLADLGDDLLHAVRTRLDDDQTRSSFLASLAIGDRVVLADPALPLGTVGAVLMAAERCG